MAVADEPLQSSFDNDQISGSEQCSGESRLAKERGSCQHNGKRDARPGCHLIPDLSWRDIRDACWRGFKDSYWRELGNWTIFFFWVSILFLALLFSICLGTWKTAPFTFFLNLERNPCKPGGRFSPFPYYNFWSGANYFDITHSDDGGTVFRPS